MNAVEGSAKLKNYRESSSVRSYVHKRVYWTCMGAYVWRNVYARDVNIRTKAANSVISARNPV